MNEIARCEICGEPMPDGEQMFKFHGFSGPCPKEPESEPKLQPHQQRVIHEKDELYERLAKLVSFIQTDMFAGLPEAERSRLRNQARFMDGYAAVLEERIAAFTAYPTVCQILKKR